MTNDTQIVFGMQTFEFDSSKVFKVLERRSPYEAVFGLNMHSYQKLA
jgi:hypothetical protein